MRIMRAPIFKFIHTLMWQCAGIAFILVFLPLYCKAIGFSDFRVSIINGLSILAAMCAAPLYLNWGLKHFGPAAIARRMPIFLLITFLPLLWVKEFLPFGLIFFIFAMINNGMMAFSEAMTLHADHEGEISYNLARGTGSVGFILASLIFGYLCDKFGLEILPALGVIVCLGVFIAQRELSTVLSVHSSKSLLKENTGILLGEKALNSQTFKILLCAAMIWASHASYYVFFSIYLESLGWSESSISISWAISVAAEIMMYFSFSHFERRFKLSFLLKISVAFTFLRWLLLTLSTEPAVLLFSQTLHAFSFASFSLSALKLFYAALPPTLKTRGQGFYFTFGLGFGSIIGRAVTSYLSYRYGEGAPYIMYFQSSLILAVPAIIIALSIQDKFQSAGQTSAKPETTLN